MRSLSSVFYFTSLVSSFAVATPFTSRQTSSTCNPDFQGVGVRIANSAVVWGAPGFSDGSKLSAVEFKDRLEILFERSNDRYFAKSLNGSALAVDKYNGELSLKPANPSSGDQTWLIECTSGCSPGLSLGPDGFLADGCKIKSASTGQCVQVGNKEFAGSVGDGITLRSCANLDSQRFNLIVSPFRQPPSPSPWPHQPSPSPTTPSWPHDDVTPTSPLPPAVSTCSPNFEGVGVRVANSAVQWGARVFANNENLAINSDFNTRMEIVFQQTGFPAVSYVAKSLNGSNLIVGARANGTLYLLDENQQSITEHRWVIECIGGCPGGNVGGGGLAADNCRLKFKATDQCVQIASRNVGDLIVLATCNGQDDQRFNFQTSPFAPTIGGAGELASNTNIKAHLADSDNNSDFSLGELKTLVRNSYIAIGLMAAVFLALVALAVVLLSRGCLKGRTAKPSYITVARGDMEGFDVPKRYSD